MFLEKTAMQVFDILHVIASPFAAVVQVIPTSNKALNPVGVQSPCAFSS